MAVHTNKDKYDMLKKYNHNNNNNNNNNNIHEMTKTIKEDLGFVRLKQTLQDLNSNVPFSCCTCAAP